MEQKKSKNSISFDRWTVTVCSPYDGSILWKKSGSTFRDIGLKWKKETGNDFITNDKLTRKNLGRLKGWASKIISIEKLPTPTSNVNFSVAKVPPTPPQSGDDNSSSESESESHQPNYVVQSSLEPLPLLMLDTEGGTAFKGDSNIVYG